MLKVILAASSFCIVNSQVLIPQPKGYPPLDIPPQPNPEFASLVDFSQIPKIPLKASLNKAPVCGDKSIMKSNCDWACGDHCTRPDDITSCKDNHHWGISFDDGPSEHTLEVLKYLNDTDIKGTFCVTGSRSVQFPDILKATFDAGHQICIHTWSHYPLTTLSNDVVIAELEYTARVVKEITGQRPVYMRPPTGDMDDRVRFISASLNMIPILWDRDTSDYKYVSIPVSNRTETNSTSTATTAQISSTPVVLSLPDGDVILQTNGTNRTYPLPEELFKAWVKKDSGSGHITVEHDLFELTATWIPPAIKVLFDTKNQKIPETPMSVAQCVGDLFPYENTSVKIPRTYAGESLNLNAIPPGPKRVFDLKRAISGHGNTTGDANRVESFGVLSFIILFAFVF